MHEGSVILLYRASSVHGGTPVMILGLDTAGQSASVALVEGTQVLASFSLRYTPTFSTHLLPLLDFLCHQAKCSRAAIEGLAVNLGPGGFTSLRVGLATAQGLAMAWDKPLVGCSAFEALAALVEGWQGSICPILEAHRGEVYAAIYRRDGLHLQEMTPGLVLSPEALCPLLPDQTLLLGNGVRAYRAQFAALLGSRAVYLEQAQEGGLAASVARRGASALQTPPPEGWPLLKPLYIRAADARLPLHPVIAGCAVAHQLPPP